MSESKEPAPGGSQIVVRQQQLARLDQFQSENSLTALMELGSASAAVGIADAIVRLGSMLDDEIMASYMTLQGKAIGFKTDKDAAGGYPLPVVRDCLVEAMMRGFNLVGNQANIIAGRFYATKEGFENFFLRQGQKGDFTDLRTEFSVPRVVSDTESIVTASASWVFKGKADKFDAFPIVIRVNKGQGADATQGKAKRKLLARIYNRVTGTVITEGEAGEAINVVATPANENAAGPATTTATPVVETTEEQKADLTKIVGKNEAAANEWLLAFGKIPKGGTYLNVDKATAERILGNPKGFLNTIGVPSV